MFCIFCEEEVEDFEFNCLRHVKCPCGMIMLDCSEVIVYKQVATFREQPPAKRTSLARFAGGRTEFKKD